MGFLAAVRTFIHRFGIVLATGFAYSKRWALVHDFSLLNARLQLVYKSCYGFNIGSFKKSINDFLDQKKCGFLLIQY